jgi:hypothetical protein
VLALALALAHTLALALAFARTLALVLSLLQLSTLPNPSISCFPCGLVVTPLPPCPTQKEQQSPTRPDKHCPVPLQIHQTPQVPVKADKQTH